MAKRGIWSRPGKEPSPGKTSDYSDRRREPRYIPAKRTAYLGWWSGDTYHMPIVRVESLSTHGAALLVEEFPTRPDEVWVSLINSGTSQWFAASVIDSSPSGGVGRVVRIALRESLPYDVFKIFCLGLPNHSQGTESPPPGTADPR